MAIKQTNNNQITLNQIKEQLSNKKRIQKLYAYAKTIKDENLNSKINKRYRNNPRRKILNQGPKQIITREADTHFENFGTKDIKSE